jgi:membrane protein
MDNLLERMMAEGWVGRVPVAAPPRVQWGKRVSEGDHWVILANVDKLTLAEVYRLFVFTGAPVNAGVIADGDDERDRQAAREAAALAREVETAVESGLGKTLAEHFGPIDCR